MLNVQNVVPAVATADPLYERLRQVEEIILKIPRELRPMKKAALTSYVDSPFADAIALVKIPKRFTVPAMKI